MTQPPALVKLLNLLKLLFFGPVFFFFIVLDRLVFRTRNPFLPFPRNVDEASRDVGGLFRYLRDNGVFPAHSELISAETRVGSETEPDKHVLRADFTYRNATNTVTETRHLFAKMPTERKWPLSLFTILSTLAPDHKEVAFYNCIWPALRKAAARSCWTSFSETNEALATTPNININSNNNNNSTNNSNTRAPAAAQHSPLVVPHKLFATWSRLNNRAFLVFDCINLAAGGFHSRPDWRAAAPATVQTMLRAIVNMHALSWRLTNKTVRDAAHACCIERGGFQWLDGLMQLYLGGAAATQTAMWDAIGRFLAAVPVCLCHGDFRAGNMLFAEDYSRVIVTDFEAVCIAPFLWDFSYAVIISLTPEDRAASENQLLEFYLELLRERVRDIRSGGGGDDNNNANDSEQDAVQSIPSLAQCLAIHRVNKLVIRYFSWMLVRMSGVGKKQGNVEQDVTVWVERVSAATHEVLRQERDTAAVLGVEVSFVREFYEDSKSGKSFTE